MTDSLDVFETVSQESNEKAPQYDLEEKQE